MFKKTLASLAVGGILVGGAVGAVGAGTASAATPAPAATSTTSGHGVKTWLKAHRKEVRRAFIATSAKAINNMTPQALAAELHSGKSVAQVAGEHGVSPQTVINALVQGADAKISQAVAAHQLTTAQGSKLQSRVPGWATKAVDHTF